MSDAAWSNLPQIIAAIALAVISIGTFMRAGRAEQHALEARDGVDAVKQDVKTIEKATNSMKDALVAATDKAARAEGHAEGMKDQRLSTSDLAQQPPRGDTL